MSTVRAAVYRNGVFSDPAGFAVPPAGSPPSVLGKGVPRPLQGRTPAVLQSAAAEVNPAAGGELELPGVARVVIPPGSLPAARPVLVRLLALKPPPELADREALTPVVWVRFRGLSKPELDKPAELFLYPGETSGVRVYAMVPGAGEKLVLVDEPLPVRVTGNALAVLIDRPSWFMAVR